MDIFHSSRAAQTAQCKAECDDYPDNHCYLDESNIGCVIGKTIPKYQGQEYQCCRVNADVFFIKTARDILTFADQVADAGTQQYRAALTNLFNDIPNPNVTGLFEANRLIITDSFFNTWKKDLLNLLDQVIPVSEYSVSCFIDDILEQPESRRRKRNITYRIYQRDLPNIDFPNNVLTLATSLEIGIERISCSRLEVILENALQISQPRPDALVTLSVENTLGTKISQTMVDRIRGYVRSSQFRGKINVYFKTRILEDNVLQGLFSSSRTVTRTIIVDPQNLIIEIGL